MIEKGFLKGLVESLSQASGLVIAKANLLLFSSEIQSAKNLPLCKLEIIPISLQESVRLPRG